MERADCMKVCDIKAGFSHVIISPTKKEAMLHYLDELSPL
jgi:hypothetical protein